MKLIKATMKSEKVTNGESPVSKRWYDDACGTALAMELVGERWSLLIVRELMFGPRRFSELRAGLPGISANVLTQRLAGLESACILHRRTLPSPANAQVYELTAWGYESERAIQELGRWAVRSPRHDPTLPLSAASLMMSFRTMFSAERAGDRTATIGIRIGNERFRIAIRSGILDIARSDADNADLLLAAPDPGILAAFIYGGEDPVPLQEAGALALTGAAELARWFATLFPLPPKLSVVR